MARRPAEMKCSTTPRLFTEGKSPDLPSASANEAAFPTRRCERNNRRGRRSPPAAMLATLCTLSLSTLAGCSALPESGFSFASSGAQSAEASSRNAAKTQARFAKGAVVLVAPRGHCVDAKTLRQDSEGGFALLPRCSFLQGNSLFGRNKAAVITATIGKTNATTAPSTSDLARTAEGAKLLYYDDKGLLPLVRLQWHGHGATGNSGASAEHWRGAFVLNGNLVVLALYAPEGSELLGRPGADLLEEMTRRSLQASSAPRSDAPPSVAPQIKESSPANQTQDAITRPKTRPNSMPNSIPEEQRTTAAQGHSAVPAEPTQKRSLRRRIAAIFQ